MHGLNGFTQAPVVVIVVYIHHGVRLNAGVHLH